MYIKLKLKICNFIIKKHYKYLCIKLSYFLEENEIEIEIEFFFLI